MPSSAVILSEAKNLRILPGATTNLEEVHINDRLQAELWTSWASLLRSYAAAHGLNSRHHAVVEVGADEITLRVANRWLRFTHDLVEDSEGNRSTFSLQEDGTVKLKEHTQEMDLAAEQLAREMMHSE
jgi:DNA-binding transcriptional regulator PaaX